MSESEAISILFQAMTWVGLLILSPFLWKLANAFAYYLTGKLRKNQILIVKHIHNSEVVSEITLDLSSNTPIVQQLDEISRRKA
ncbi:hypothetical protein CRM81_08845 [Yersinia kristensenii]|nr:hypothetical protein CRM81_08845 [Yersinia kristensenii]